jgi:hypothetical protein
MKKHTVTLPILGLIASTRAMLGAGIALLLADKLDREERRAVGWSLFAVGVLTTIPLLVQLATEGETREISTRAEIPEPQAASSVEI